MFTDESGFAAFFHLAVVSVEFRTENEVTAKTWTEWKGGKNKGTDGGCAIVLIHITHIKEFWKIKRVSNRVQRGANGTSANLSRILFYQNIEMIPKTLSWKE